MSHRQRIYLDNAATSWPKPESVYQAVEHFQRELGAPVGRGTYAEAAEVERIVARARVQLAQLIGVSEPRRVVFRHNCTAALNLALHGLLKAGDHVVTTVIEHNSVLRPLRDLEEHGSITVTRVRCDEQGMVDPDDIRRAIQPNTRLIAASHASNVTGAILPVVEFGRIAREHGARFLVDAAQTAGHLPLDIAQMHADLLAAPGHKGLLGPLGTGFLYVAPGVEPELESLEQGGTGTLSENDRQPEMLPDKYESGNLNASGLVGLEAALSYVRERGIESLCRDSRQLSARLWEGLRQIEGVSLFGPPLASQRVGVVSLAVEGYEPQELAALLDSAYHIQCRAGLHCAPFMHQALNTISRGGTVRLSLGPFNTEEHIAAAIEAISEMASARIS